MPEAPVLTKKQQKSALSKKNRSKVTIRNVLASPYGKYWPLISSEEAESLSTILSKHLPILTPTKIYIPWKQLREVPKSERKSFRQKYTENQTNSDKTEVGSREGLILGVNDVTKGLESGNVHCVLITADVKPKLMVEHIIDQSILLQIPVLVVPELRKVVKDTCGISSVTIAFTDVIKYAEIHEAIEQIAVNYPIPRNHIHFNRITAASENSVIVIDDSIIEINEEEDRRNFSEQNCDDKQQDPSTDGIYLYRKSVTERVFVPEKSCGQMNNPGHMSMDSMEFLPFAVSSAPTLPKFKSLMVKRMKGDVNRTKRKITQIKGKNNKKQNRKRPIRNTKLNS